MSVQTASRLKPETRRQRAGAIVASALRGGLIGTVVAAVAWLIAGALTGTAFVLLVVASLAVVAWVAFRGAVRSSVWLVLAVAWAVVLIERAVVQENGGVWVAAAGWLGVIYAARRAGISKWALPLLAYPLISVAIVVAAGEDLLEPWGTSWLWLAAVLGPVVGLRTLLKPPPETPSAP
ncbi:MAG TPA: hypothetical protein VNO82_21060 [Solirubrobacteraceae bacterium]|nr:hypothetical protein [Solirubrobacteraceae bacterium]